MNRIKQAALIFALLSLVACNQTTTAPSTSDVTDQQAFAEARSVLLSRLKDPDSAKFGQLTRKTISPVLALTLIGISVDQRTDLVCGTVNSKNSYGGYTGAAVFAYRISRKDIFVDKVAGERIGSMWCVDSTPA